MYAVTVKPMCFWLIQFFSWPSILRAVVCLPDNITFLATRMGTSLLMELDTGAGILVISKETYKKHFIGTPLMPSNTRLSAYAGHPLKVHEQLIAQLKYQDQSADVPLIVAEGTGLPLFGRDWLSRIRLAWTKISNIRVSEAKHPGRISWRPSWDCTHEINSPQSCLVAENRPGDWKGYPWMSTVQQNPQGSSSLTASSMVLADSSIATCSRRFCHPPGKILPHHGRRPL